MTTFLAALVRVFYRTIEVVMVACMTVMLVMVLGNVLLRLFFNSGIDLSEEIPRFAFVWMTFLGAIVGLHRRAHLGVDMVVRALPVLGRRICWGLSQAIMLVCSLYIFYGTWLQHDIIAGNASPVARISTLWVYGVSYFTGAAIAVICATNLVRLVLGSVSDNELIDVQEEGVTEALGEAADMQGGRQGSGSRP